MISFGGATPPDDSETRERWGEEKTAAWLYGALARSEGDATRSQLFRDLAGEADHVEIVIHPDNTATFYVGKTDGGQGTGTAFRQMMCDELDIERGGDCSAPGIIASAVLAGHRYAREMDGPAVEVPFRRDDPVIVD